MEEAAEYDLIVAGAGPAGCACAITAARGGARVLLLEKDKLPRHKVCGEFVSPESLELLGWLLGRERFGSQPEIGAARIFLQNKCATIKVAPPARSIPRFDLDAALLEAARAQGTLAREEIEVREVQERGGRFQVITASETFIGKAMVNASGRWSRLKQQGPPSNGARWIGIKEHFREPGPPASVDLYFFPGGYCGVQPVSNNAVNACAMVRSDVARTLPEVFALHPELARRSKDWEPLFPAVTTSGLIFREPATQDGGTLLVGDAAGFIDPFAGDGISLALHSGTLAAECLLGFLQGRLTPAEARACYRAGYMRRFTPAFRNAARLRRLLDAPAWIRSGILGLFGKEPLAGFIMRTTRAR